MSAAFKHQTLCAVCYVCMVTLHPAASGFMFLSTPNIAGLSSMTRSLDGFAPYAYSKYLSMQDGVGEPTHVRGGVQDVEPLAAAA
jgi:hypothetical protein